MYSHDFLPQAGVEPIGRRTVWMVVAAALAVVIAIVVVALASSSTSHVRTSVHRASEAARGLPAATPPLVPRGFVRDGFTHQLLPIEGSNASAIPSADTLGRR
ncbi:MAG TPA: hypothetical protein VG371_06195 [Solirubrobacteraceae bacterium]|jgi:hypothetical protein|nr:hypothetical protein [Solirubrobacteraceae bacterium]